MDKNVEEFMEMIKEKNPGEKEFHQAIQEVAESIMPFIQKNPKYKKYIKNQANETVEDLVKENKL